MSTTQKTPPPRLRYHPRAYDFLFAALRRSQQKLGRTRSQGLGDECRHITGPELLEGIREFALEQFGLMARMVFHCWSIHTTEDFGRMVFDLIERGEMSKTDSDQLSDFSDVFDFEEALDQQYQVDVSHAFS
ncbi:MAG: Minf_1886 family protein [Deltaproteobacteria bacterium]